MAVVPIYIPTNSAKGKAFILDYSPPVQRLVNEGPDMNLTLPFVGFFKQGRRLGTTL